MIYLRCSLLYRGSIEHLRNTSKGVHGAYSVNGIGYAENYKRFGFRISEYLFDIYMNILRYSLCTAVQLNIIRNTSKSVHGAHTGNGICYCETDKKFEFAIVKYP